MVDLKKEVRTTATPAAPAPELTEMARQDPELKEMLRLIHRYDLRVEAMLLLDDAIFTASRKKPKRSNA